MFINILNCREYLDLSRGQAILQEVAERRELPVFNELEAALQCTQLLLRGGCLEISAAFPGNAPPAPAIAIHLMLVLFNYHFFIFCLFHRHIIEKYLYL